MTTYNYVSSTALAKSILVGSPLGTSDHSSVSLSLSVPKPTPPPHCRWVWLYSQVDFQALNDHLLESLDDGVTGSSAESQWLGLKRNFMSIVKKHIPMRSISCRKHHPWITNSIMNMLRCRDRVYKAAKCSELWAKYCTLCNRVVGSMRKASSALCLEGSR